MNLRSLMFAVLFLNLSAAFAQDVIVTTDGEELKVKVEEVALNEIRYRKFDNLDGPVIAIAKADVFMIKFANGTKEIIKAQPRELKEDYLLPEETRIETKGSSFYQNGVRQNLYSVFKIINKSGNKAAINELMMYDHKQHSKKISLGFGIPLTIVGGVFILTSTVVLTEGANSNTKRTFRDVQIGGFCLFPIGVACIVNGIVLNSKANAHMRKSIYLYNMGLKDK